MSKHHKLSLISAIFININIMLGSGIFINSTVLANMVGALGALCYTLVGILMLPLIISITRLLALHPSGGFYTYGAQEIHPFAGFFSAWSYATGKLASAVIITQFAVLLLQQVIPALASIDPLMLNGSIMGLFILLNMFDIQTGSSIQNAFFVLKTVPVLFGMLVGMYLFSGAHLAAEPISFEAIPSALPLVLFALAGFEAACSLSSKIENATRNGPIAIYASYAVVIGATTLFQFLIYAGLGNALAQFVDYRSLFPALLTGLLPTHAQIAHQFSNIIHLAIAASALGGSYGIIFSNSWNMYTLAQHHHLFGAKRMIQLNRYHIPWLCVVAEAIIYYLYLFVSQGSQIPLQQIGAIGPTIAYSISALSLLFYYWKKSESIILPTIALGSCTLLFTAGIYSLILDGISSLALFGTLSLIGSAMFWLTYSSSNLNGDKSYNAK